MVRRHRSPSPMSFEWTRDLCDAPGSFEPPATCAGADGDMPAALVDVFAADIFAKAGL